MARQGLPKKYAKMGFKRGWAAYKRSKNKRTSSPRRARTPTTRRRRTMAKAKRKYTKRRVPAMTPQKAVIGGFIYGFGRGQLNNLVKGLTSNVALNLSDEIALGIANWYLAKKTKGMVRNAAIVGLGIEAYNVGRSSGGIGNLFGGSSTTNTNGGW